MRNFKIGAVDERLAASGRVVDDPKGHGQQGFDVVDRDRVRGAGRYMAKVRALKRMQPQLPLPGFGPAPGHGVQRLFFALWPDAALRQRMDDVTRHLATTQATGGRRMSPERYHLTLQFLGDFEPLPPSLLEAAIAAAAEVSVAGFALPLERAGSFGEARVGWLGPAEIPVPLQTLWGVLEAALARHGVKSRSPATFSPHVTVLREMRRPLRAIPIVPALAWWVDGFVLIRSEPGHGVYTVLRRWALGAGRLRGRRPSFPA